MNLIPFSFHNKITPESLFIHRSYSKNFSHPFSSLCSQSQKMVKIFKIATFLSLLSLLSVVHGWGEDGHFIVCRIAQPRLSKAAADAVKKLLPDYAGDDLASLCSWADHVKFRYHWSSALHYIDTPDSLCNYKYTRDCHDENGEKDRCVAGAINNYTNQIQSFGSSSSKAKYNLTEALLFLSHFMGDIHQPLHVGFTTDKGGNTIDVHWYTTKTVLHHVWDDSIILTALDRFYGSDVENMLNEIKQNITGDWADRVEKWEACSSNEISCPDIYASESITAACDYAYKDVTEDSTLEDDYFLSRLPVVNLQLAKSGVRLAATLNRALG